MWYFTWILGLLLACSLGIINVLRLEAQDALAKELIPLDPLTHLITKDTMLTRIWEKIENSKHNGFPFSVMVISLLDFKNQHQLLDYELDATVRSVAEYLKTETRAGVDIISRSSEHEFLCAMPGSSLHTAKELAIKFKNEIYTQVKAPRNLAVAAEIGVSEYSYFAAGNSNDDLTTTEIVAKLVELAALNTQASQHQNA